LTDKLKSYIFAARKRGRKEEKKAGKIDARGAKNKKIKSLQT